MEKCKQEKQGMNEALNTSKNEEFKVEQENREESEQCKVCGLSEQPLSKAYTPKKAKRTRKLSAKAAANTKKESWIACCVCNEWLHIACVGITKDENKKLRGKAFYKCLVCCFKLAKLFKNSLELALDIDINTHTEVFDCSKRSPQTANTPRPLNVKCELFSDKDATTDIVSILKPTEPVTPLSVVSFLDSCLEKEILLKERTKSEKSETVKDKSGEFPREVKEFSQSSNLSNTEKSEVVRKKSQEYRRDARKSKQCIESRSSIKAEVTEVDKYIIQKEEEKEVRSRIIVIDDIPNSKDFLNSKEILKEFKNYCKDITVTAAFRLAKGGISIYFKSKEDRDKALEKLSEKSFGGGKKNCLSEEKAIPVFLKSIDTGICTSVIENTIKQEVGKVISCRRLFNYNTGRPRQVIKVLCSEKIAHKLLSAEIYLEDQKITVEPSRNKEVVRCYNCQAFGHLSSNCSKESKCRNCASISCSGPCRNDPYCANCEGKHKSSDTSCPTFIQRNEIVASKHTISEHLTVSPENRHRSASA